MEIPEYMQHQRTLSQRQNENSADNNHNNHFDHSLASTSQHQILDDPH